MTVSCVACCESKWKIGWLCDHTSKAAVGQGQCVYVCVQTSKAPFMNVIYDKDPITQWVFGRVALMGEAAHPTTPHGSRRCVCMRNAPCPRQLYGTDSLVIQTAWHRTTFDASCGLYEYQLHIHSLQQIQINLRSFKSTRKWVLELSKVQLLYPLLLLNWALAPQ